LLANPFFQKINTLFEKASIEVEGKHFDLIFIFFFSVPGFTSYLMFWISSFFRLTYEPGIFPGILSQ
jgi:hypothetical protein